MAIIKSVLKETIENLPEDFKMKSQSVAPMLLKKGVKQEELHWSGLEIKDGVVVKTDLVEAEAKRKDEFNIETSNTFNTYSLKDARGNPTYREKILTFKDDGIEEIVPVEPDRLSKFRHLEGAMYDVDHARIDSLSAELGFPTGLGDDQLRARMERELKKATPQSRYTSNHFKEIPNYLAHTRVYDEEVNGVPTRVLQEIQSDLHQDARKAGGYAEEPMTAELYKAKLNEIIESAYDFARSSGYEVEGTPDIREIMEEVRVTDPELYEVLQAEDYKITQLTNSFVEGSQVPSSPQEKTWLVKGIERELVDAINDGKQQLAIPIKGHGISELYRADGVQKWYETQVLNTAKKVAKRANAEFEIYKKPVKLINPDLQDLGKMELDELTALVTRAREGYDSNTANDAFRQLDSALGSVSSLIENTTDSLIAKYVLEEYDDAFLTYAVIKPAGEMTVSLSAKEAYSQMAPLLERQDFIEEALAKDFPEYGGYLGWHDIVQLTSRSDELTSDQQGLIKEYFESATKADEIRQKSKKPEFKAKAVEFSLYSSPAAGAMAYYTAIQEGYTEEEIMQHLQEKGATPEQLEKYKKASSAVAEAKENGYTDEQITAHINKMFKPAFTEQNAVPEWKKSEALNRWASSDGLSKRGSSLDKVVNKDLEDAKDLLVNLRTIKPVLTSNIMTDIPAFLGNQEAVIRHAEAREASRAWILQYANDKYGVEFAWEGKEIGDESWKYIDKNGEVQEVTISFMEELAAEKGEIIGGVGGAILGFKAAPPVAPFVGALSKPLAAAGGGLVGAVVGSQADYLWSAMELQADMEYEDMALTAFNAAEIAVIGEAIGAGAVKTLGVGWKYLMKAKDLILDGNSEGAYKALKETTNYSDDELTELVTRLEKVMAVPGRTDKEKAMSAVALTEPGFQDLIRAASGIDSISSKQVLDMVDRRAKSVLAATNDISTPNASIRFVEDLANYNSDVKAVYSKVKAQATEAPGADNFSFDYDQLTIEPVLEKLYDKIFDTNVSEKFLRQAQHIKKMSESRSFADLIELRQLTNDFLFNKRITKADDVGMLRDVVNRIDVMIEEAAEVTMQNPEKWLEDWATAKSEYSKMKKLQETAMFRLVFDKNGKVKPVTPEAVTKAMTKYLTTLDGNFDALLDQLPANSRKIYEGAIVDTLANKYTIGYSSENQAVHFPALAEELNKLKFTSPEARATKNALLELSDIFKNELPLALTNSSFKVPKFQSYLTTDPVVRAKFELASGVFNYIKTLAPTREQRSSALIHKVAKLLEDPLNAKTANEVIEDFRQSPEILKMISQVQRDTAYAQAKGMDSKSMKVQIFEGGKYKGSGAPIARIGRHRIASIEIVQQIADEEAISVNSKMLDSILKQHGYAAVENGTDRVRLLK